MFTLPPNPVQSIVNSGLAKRLPQEIGRKYWKFTPVMTLFFLVKGDDIETWPCDRNRQLPVNTSGQNIWVGVMQLTYFDWMVLLDVLSLNCLCSFHF